ncbi:MAG: bifunctional histidine phosphatase family protein/GNAT family N-acetyltransferase [Oscillospiraceae bacterium]
MTKIYLIRHAEAEGNFYRRIQGQYDGHITRRGFTQIDALAERLRDIKIDALYSSDLTRTKTTAGAVLRYHDLVLNTEPRLREIFMGEWEDLPWGNAEYDTPEQMYLFANDPEKWDVPGGEHFEALKARITGIILELAARHNGQTIAVFCHGTAIRTLLSNIMGIPSERIQEIPHGDNTSVSLLEVDGENIKIEFSNDNSHLNSETSTFLNQTWWKDSKKPDLHNLRLIPMNLDEDAAIYRASYADAWHEAHGTINGFVSGPYVKCAQYASRKNPQALMKAMSGDSFAGIIELDPNRMASENAGWISFCYLVPELRGRHMAPQLVGHAVSKYREMNRTCLRLHVAETNNRAIKFYENLGFQHMSTEPGIMSPLWLMQMPL